MSSLAARSLPAADALRGPSRLALLALGFATLTILLGAMTTSTGSGLAYPDFPLSDGQLMPEKSYTTIPGFLEHFHRIAAATTGLLTLGLALWLQFGRLPATTARGTAWFCGCLTLTQGLVGGTGVLKGLPAWSSVTHGTLAQLTLATLAWISYQLSPRYRATPIVTAVAPGSGRKLAMVALIGLVAQTVLGALARHTNSPQALWTHVSNAFVVFLLAAIASAFAVGRLGETPGVKAHSRWLLILLLVQVVLGFVALVVRNPEGKTQENVENLGAAFFISLHVLVGALLTTLIASLAAHVFRATRSPAAQERA